MAIPTRWGSEILVSPEGSQNTPDSRVIGLSDGRFLIVWGSTLQSDGTTGSDVRGQIYGADGVQQGASFTLTSNPQGAQVMPDIAELTGGKFATTWFEVGGLSKDQDGWAVRGSLLNANGTVSSMFDVPTTTADAQYGSRVTALPDGGYVITWEDHSAVATGTGTLFDIRAQVYNSNGSKRGGEILVNTTTDGYQALPAITALTNGNFVISWWDESPHPGDLASTSVRAQIFTPAGAKVGSEFLLNTVTPGAQAFAQLTALKSGGFFATYADYSGTLGDPNGAAVGQFFTATGTPVGPVVVLNSKMDGNQTNPDVTELPDGRLVAVWVDYTPNGSGYDHDVRGQVINADGTKSGEEFLVNTSSAGIQDAPNVASLGDGRFVVSWTEDTNALDTASNVHAQIFDPRTAAVNLTGGDKSENWYGTAFNDTLKGGKGNDVHHGANGNDVLVGDQGNDSLYGEQGNDNLSGGSGNDLLVGDIGNDTLSGGAGNDRILAGLGLDNISGGKGNDVFVFASAAEISASGQNDKISDFEHGLDDIDLSAFMHNGSFIGAAAFSHHAGEVHYEVATGILTGDVNGDGTADWQLVISNKAALAADDFIF